MVSVQSIMTSKVVSVKPETPVFDAINLLVKSRISGVPVVDSENRVVGIFSEKDVLEMLIDKNSDIKKTVDDYMTRDVVCFTEEDSAIDICKFFIRSDLRRVPVVKDGKLVGIVSRRNIIELILEAKNKI